MDDKKIDYTCISGPLPPTTKSPALYAHNREGNYAWPLVYFRKPRNVSQEDFDDAVENIRRFYGDSG